MCSTLYVGAAIAVEAKQRKITVMSDFMEQLKTLTMAQPVRHLQIQLLDESQKMHVKSGA